MSISKYAWVLFHHLLLLALFLSENVNKGTYRHSLRLQEFLHYRAYYFVHGLHLQNAVEKSIAK